MAFTLETAHFLPHMPLVLLPHLSCLVNSLVASRPARFLLDLQAIRQWSTSSWEVAYSWPTSPLPTLLLDTSAKAVDPRWWCLYFWKGRLSWCSHVFRFGPMPVVCSLKSWLKGCPNLRQLIFNGFESVEALGLHH